jgi:hypothetical protein
MMRSPPSRKHIIYELHVTGKIRETNFKIIDFKET